MQLKEIISIIEKEFPKESAYEWDNVGLLVGDTKSEIKTVLVTLDITPFVIEEAIKNKAELILSHHPIMFDAAKTITPDTKDGKIILKAIKNNINIYAAHTNCDVGKNGINEALASLFELKKAKILEENGLGRIGFLEKEMPAADFIKIVKEKLGIKMIRVCGDTKKTVKKIAIGSGACADSIPLAKSKGADLMLTADVKYHEMLDAEENGIIVVDAGHYATEIIVMDIFEKVLEKKDIKIVKSKNKDAIKFM